MWRDIGLIKDFWRVNYTENTPKKTKIKSDIKTNLARKRYSYVLGIKSLECMKSINYSILCTAIIIQCHKIELAGPTDHSIIFWLMILFDFSVFVVLHLLFIPVHQPKHLHWHKVFARRTSVSTIYTGLAEESAAECDLIGFANTDT